MRSKKHDYSFNGNLMVSYTDVLLGSSLRLENTQPDTNTDRITGRIISNPTMLLGFVFDYMLDCRDEEEAFTYYKKNKTEMDRIYKVDRIIKHLSIKEGCGVRLTPNKQLHLALYMYYEERNDLDPKKIQNILNPPKIRRIEEDR